MGPHDTPSGAVTHPCPPPSAATFRYRTFRYSTLRRALSGSIDAPALPARSRSKEGARMRGDPSKALALVLVLATLGSTGCGPRLITSLPEPPPKKRATGPVALVMPNTPPGVKIQQPGFENRGSTRMSESFYRRYVTATQAPVGPPAGPPPEFPALVGFGAAALAGRGPGAGVGIGLALGLGLVMGTIVVDSAKSTVAVLNAFADMRIKEALASGIVEVGQSRRILPPIGDQSEAATPVAEFLLVLERIEVS